MEELCRIIARVCCCPSCQKEFQEPKVLSCSHTLCLQCVKRLAIQEAETNSPKIRCPTCKTETVLSSEGTSGMPTNAVIVSLMSAVHAFKVDHGLEEKVGLWKFKLKEIDLPSKDCANGMSATQDNRIGLVDRFGGIHLYSSSGFIKTILTGVQKIQGVVFFQNDQFAVLFRGVSDYTVRIYSYTSLNECPHVKFDTMSIEEGGCGVLAGSNKGNVYVGYYGMENRRIQIFSQYGGEPVGEIPCIGFEAKKLLVVASGDLLVADICYEGGEVRSSSIHLIDERGRKKWSTKKEGVHAQLALGQNDTTLISWLKSGSHGSANDIGLLTIEQYSKDMEDMKTLISNCEVITSTFPSYHLQQFSSGELAFCTADKLYIFTRISDA